MGSTRGYEGMEEWAESGEDEVMHGFVKNETRN
jgi:hypothetical protein